MSLLKPAGGSRGVEDQEEAGNQGAPPIIIDGEEVYRVQEVWTLVAGAGYYST